MPTRNRQAAADGPVAPSEEVELDPGVQFLFYAGLLEPQMETRPAVSGLAKGAVLAVSRN